ncbi:MAG: hypothetical protein K6G56_03575 [Clostridiales bacterium]|nr:hypothetical protein [Clostridiales bacterium]
MKNSVIKTITLLLIAVMLITAFAACKKPDAPVDASPAPTEQQAEAPTEEPTAEPVVTEEPTTEPTEQPTPEPTAVPNEAPLPEDPEDIGDCIKDAEVLLYLPYGEDDGCVGFKEADYYDDDQDRSAESFAVVDGKVFVLDSINHRVLISYKGEITSFPIIEPALRTQLMCVIDNRIYLAQTRKAYNIPFEVIAYDYSGTIVDRITLPEGSFLHALIDYEGQLAFLEVHGIIYGYENGEWEEIGRWKELPMEEDKYSFTIGDKTIVIDREEKHLPWVYLWNEAYVYLTVYGPNFKYSYCVYDYDGELIGGTSVDPSEAVFYPQNPMYIAADGTLYVMCWMQDGVYITKPNLRTEYVSHLGESAESGN